jgi:hypothetical protein
MSERTKKQWNYIFQLKVTKQKKYIINEINKFVDWLRQVAIKSHNFFQYYVLHKLSKGEVLDCSAFTPDCICGFMQPVVGYPVTLTDLSLPQDHQVVYKCDVA